MNIQGFGAGYRSEMVGRSETGQEAELLGEGLSQTKAQGDELQDAFRQFVGTTFFGCPILNCDRYRAGTGACP